ncbi:MAG: alpha-L-fucosidase [Rikenellaceae bacterium]
MNKLQSLIASSLLLASCGGGGAAQSDLETGPYAAEWESLKSHNAAPDWFADAKLGIYFHWGVYSVPAWGTEWYPRWMYVPDRDEGWGHDIYEYHKETYGENFHYHDFIPQWSAPNFDAKEWGDMFEGMGAKFIGSIAEHHDGFSMWDSKVNKWNSVDMGPRIDVVDAIAQEAKSRGLKYMTTFHHGYSHLFYPKNRSNYKEQVGNMGIYENEGIGRYMYVYDKSEVPQDEKYRLLYGTIPYKEANDYWLSKLDEVIENHCPDYIWMDFGQMFITEEHRQKFLQHYFNKANKLGKEVVVNTKGDFFPTELAVVNVERATMADITPDVWITDFILGSNWCFNRAKRTAINPNQAIKMLAEVVSKNGVMLLSAGPMADGTMPEEQVKAMEGIGRWMKLYGEAIYNTRPFISYGQGVTKLVRDPQDEWNDYGAIKKNLNKLNAEDIRYTFDRATNTIYAIQLGWKKGGLSHELKAFEAKNKIKVKGVEVLGSSEKIDWKLLPTGLKVTQPKAKPAEGDAAIVYKITTL